MRYGSSLTIVFCATVLMICGINLGEEVVRNFDNGKKRLRYSVDKEGNRQGNYCEYYPNGKVKIKASYQKNKLTGSYTEYDEKGKRRKVAQYIDGQLHGWCKVFDNNRLVSEQRYFKGRMLYPKTKEIISKTLKRISASRIEVVVPDNSFIDKSGKGLVLRHKKSASDSSPAFPGIPVIPGKVKTSNGSRRKRFFLTPRGLQAKSVRRLMAYRFLCDVPYEGFKVDPGQIGLATAAAKICQDNKMLSHFPPNPGWPEKEYKIARQGAKECNLAKGRDMVGSVDMYMNDSDPRNIRRVGHRRWCLNPPMGKVGFGVGGKFSAMYVRDRSRMDVPDFDYVAYPARGYMPVKFFEPGYAWSVSLNPNKYQQPEKGSVRVGVFPVGKTFDPKSFSNGKQLTLNYFNVNTDGCGIANGIIFRPAGIRLVKGKRYWVQIEGVKTCDGDPANIEYIVEWI